MTDLMPLAPTNDVAIEYDRRHLALYASLLDAAEAGGCWQSAATDLMGLDLASKGAEDCWRSHLERARWIIGEGLPSAVDRFGSLPVEVD